MKSKQNNAEPIYRKRIVKMSDIWTFSPSSKEEVEKCIAAANFPDVNNKWIIRFGHKNQFNSNITSTDFNQDKSIVSTVPPVLDLVCLDRKEDLHLEHFEELSESIENEPIARFKLMVNESCKNHRLLIHLANKLSINAVEKILNHIFEVKELESKFIENFHQYFIPTLLQKDHTWFTLDMLVKSYRTYPKSFEKLLKIILKDVQISNKVLQDLIENLNEKEVTDIIIIIMFLDFSTEEFLHNIFNICMAYKSCKKTMEVQHWISKQLTQYSNVCVTDKNYGKLLLAFLQAEKEFQSLKSYESIEKVVEMHRSPFRRPCLNVLQELLSKSNSMDTTGVYTDVI